MDCSVIAKHVNLCMAAADSLIRYRMRFAVTTFCLAAAIFPLVTALGILEGLRHEADISIKEGADAYISGEQLGANGPLSLVEVRDLLESSHVAARTTRVVGRTYFADRLVAVLGLDKQALASLRSIVWGSVPRAPGEVIVGRAPAEGFNLRVGMPFILPAHKAKVFKIVGILEPTCLWSANLLIMDHEDANEFFRMKGYTAQLLLYGISETSALFQGTGAALTSRGQRTAQQFVVQTRDETAKKVERAYDARNGVFTVLFCTGAVLAIAAFLITSGLGTGQMRKEIGVLRALGWSTWDVLQKATLENLVVCVAASAIAVLIATAWLKGLNGVLIGQFYVAEVGLIPRVPIPFKILPLHGVLCFLVALVAIGPSSLVSTALRARRPPIESAGNQ
jgi:ABC-type lipoprotein release transport system permease subunit